jgi:hypothetical protein
MRVLGLPMRNTQGDRRGSNPRPSEPQVTRGIRGLSRRDAEGAFALHPKSRCLLAIVGGLQISPMYLAPRCGMCALTVASVRRRRGRAGARCQPRRRRVHLPGGGAAGGRPLECAARCGTGYCPPPTVAKVSCVCGFWYGSLRALYSCTPAAFGSSPCWNVGLPSSSTSRPLLLNSL